MGERSSDEGSQHTCWKRRAFVAHAHRIQLLRPSELDQVSLAAQTHVNRPAVAHTRGPVSQEGTSSRQRAQHACEGAWAMGASFAHNQSRGRHASSRQQKSLPRLHSLSRRDQSSVESREPRAEQGWLGGGTARRVAEAGSGLRLVSCTILFLVLSYIVWCVVPAAREPPYRARFNPQSGKDVSR